MVSRYAREQREVAIEKAVKNASKLQKAAAAKVKADSKKILVKRAEINKYNEDAIIAKDEGFDSVEDYREAAKVAADEADAEAAAAADEAAKVAAAADSDGE